MSAVIDQERLAVVQGVALKAGGHSGPDDGYCVMGRAKRGLPLAARLARLLKPSGNCLVFVGNRTEQGYGRINVGGKQVGAHRVAWELVHGPIPDGLCVLHRCDNPPCCYVDHLFLGTVGENNADRATKGRSKGVFRVNDPSHPATQRAGEKHWQARLSDADVEAIRVARAAGVTTVSLAAKYGVHTATISRIARGVWRRKEV